MKRQTRDKWKPNLAEVTELAECQPTHEEIAAELGVEFSVFKETLGSNEWLREAIDNGKALGRYKLRSKMFELATAGNATVQQWLSRQYLGYASNGIAEKMEKKPSPLDKFLPHNRKPFSPKVVEMKGGR